MVAGAGMKLTVLMSLWHPWLDSGDRWIGELDDDLDTEVNTKTEEHDHSSDDDEDKEDIILADGGE
ncbi:hypothetical protein M405DRAFT_937586 [Rhizopogon salebrosus TDB-379]|nr:hypothetical protein M405DRAFT_937586 [Rhizopogon salebrosus TDB-379]